MDDSFTVKVVKSRNKLSNKGPGLGLFQSLVFVVVFDEGEKFTTLGQLHHQTVQCV